VQDTGDGEAGYIWQLTWAENVFKVLGPVIADNHTTDVRSMSEVVGELPEGSFCRRCEDNGSE
jgi:hypothetical protein